MKLNMFKPILLFVAIFLLASMPVTEGGGLKKVLKKAKRIVQEVVKDTVKAPAAVVNAVKSVAQGDVKGAVQGVAQAVVNTHLGGATDIVKAALVGAVK
jgi:ABC-type transporter lipoprotein component MlaA